MLRSIHPRGSLDSSCPLRFLWCFLLTVHLPPLTPTLRKKRHALLSNSSETCGGFKFRSSNLSRRAWILSMLSRARSPVDESDSSRMLAFRAALYASRASFTRSESRNESPRSTKTRLRGWLPSSCDISERRQSVCRFLDSAPSSPTTSPHGSFRLSIDPLRRRDITRHERRLMSHRGKDCASSSESLERVHQVL